MTEWRSRLRAIVPGLVLFCCSLLAAELGLRLLTWSSRDVAVLLGTDTASPPTTRVLDDDRLGRRGNPDFYEHDRRGFRNDSALSAVSIVTLGDSQTYGTSVAFDHSWPRELERLTEGSVYNMGFPGWGSSHAVANLPTAVELQPEVLVFGFYFGNDLYDDFAFARRNGMLDRYMEGPELAEIHRLESKSTIEDEVGFLFRSGRTVATPTERANGLRSVRVALSDHSRLYGLLRAVKNHVFLRPGRGILAVEFDAAVNGLSERQRAFVSIYDGADWRTILTPRYRARVLDQRDPRIRLGMEVLERNLIEMRDSAQAAGGDLLVLLLPTKESVFWPRAEHATDRGPLARLARDERDVRERLKAFLQAQGIRFVDPLASLRGSGEQPYFVSGDGHPNVLGHQLIAAEVAAVLPGDSDSVLR